ncbi:MAG TPA: M28 family peptidase [Vicinamibacterales bacterium]|jgi:hypothetical protein
MTKRILSADKFFPAVCLVLAVGAGAATMASSSGLDAANEAWERGDYIGALQSYIRLLNGPGSDALIEPIALTTGELYRTSELTADGRAGRFSPDGRFIVYETGLETSRRTIVRRATGDHATVADLPGVSATFAPDGSKVAYLRIAETPDFRAAARALDEATLTQRDRSTLVQMITWLITRDSTIVVRDLASANEIELPTPIMLKTALTYAADGRTLYFLGTREGNDTRTDIYSISETSDGPTLAVDAAGLKSAPIIDPSGGALVYIVPATSPLRRPDQPEAAGALPRGARTPSTFGIADLRSRRVSLVTGTAPALSGDGKTLAYVARDGADYTLMVGPTTGLQLPIKRTTMRMDAPALSADGTRVAWQMMPRDDWEIFTGSVGGSALVGERRVTNDIQHDVLPRFIGADRILAVAGEPRHRRSYLYDLSAGAGDLSGASADAAAERLPRRTRLFHNNTVRTIAPEYQWVVSPDETKVIVGAERDGDTVSPARGVYLVDTNQRVTKADLLARLRGNLAGETALRARGVSTFQPIAAAVRQAVSRVSVDRIFQYEKALFDFGSKHVSQPGNHQASEFLFDTYTSFDYEPDYQWFDPSAAREGETAARSTTQAFGGRTANVVATLRGTVNPEIVYVVSSHFDSVAVGPGADDDSSGTSALLEAARVLAGHPLPATVVFASMTGEEAGLLGSREFVRRAVEQHLHVAAALNNDMIGWANDQRMDNTIRYSNDGIRDVQHAAAMLFTKLITFDARYWKGTDAASFYDAYGDVLGGIGSYPVLSSPYYHQASDRLENENHQLIAETSKATVASIMLLASSPSRLTHLKIDSHVGTAASISWTPSPEKGVTSYIVAYGPPAAPLQHRVTVVQPRAALPLVAPGTIISVKAVNANGLEGWDWAHVTVSDQKPQTLTQP